MRGRDPLGVRMLEGHVSYRDGSEERILEVLRGAADRSCDSDELAAAITDWPSRYHLSRQRASLLRPLRAPSSRRPKHHRPAASPGVPKRCAFCPTPSARWAPSPWGALPTLASKVSMRPADWPKDAVLPRAAVKTKWTRCTPSW